MKRITLTIIAFVAFSAMMQSCKMHAPYRNPHPAQRFATTPVPAANTQLVKG